MTNDHTTTWTPGPWRSWPRNSYGYLEVRNAMGNLVALVKGDMAESEANARLIAAAPEMVAALEDMLSGWRYIRAHHGDLYGVGWDRAQEAAEKALARASGAGTK